MTTEPAGTPAPPVRVAVCAATYRRPEGLAALLDSFAELDLPDGVQVTFVIVDNDAAASARPTVESRRSRLPREVIYEVEESKGIPFARNRAVAAAGEIDWLAFVDDDETVCRSWLAELLRVAQAYDADVVTGTVLPVFAEPPPAWALRGRFFERARFPTGTALPYARTSNVLIAGRLLLASPRPFSEALADNGGDDTHFFQRVRLAGGRIVWADEATVEEVVPPSRVRPRWLVQREYRRGNTLSLCLRDLEDSPRRRAKRLAAAGYHALVGAGLIASALLRGRVAALSGAQRIAFAAGLTTGLTGHAYQEYAVVHGR